MTGTMVDVVSDRDGPARFCSATTFTRHMVAWPGVFQNPGLCEEGCDCQG